MSDKTPMKFKSIFPDNGENSFFTMVESSKDDLEINSESFTVIAGHLHEWSMRDKTPPSKIRVWCKEKNGFSNRDYVVLSLKPLKLIPEGGWRHAKIPEKDEAPPKEGVQTLREIFVPSLCAPEDLNEFGYLKGEPTYLDDDQKWVIRGEGTGKVYMSGIPLRVEAMEIMKGQKPYMLAA